jgi:DNA-binding NarL/FixJ family response regulator
MKRMNKDQDINVEIKEIKPIRVFMIDDHEVVRQGLSVILEEEPDIEIVGVASSGEKVIKIIRKANPNVVLMDIRMPGTDGFKATHEIRKACPRVAVIMLTGYESELYATEALRAGASGYITKDCPRQLLINAIRVVRHGGTVWQGDPLRGGSYTKAISTKAPVKPNSVTKKLKKQLTVREIDVLALLAKGYGNKQISTTMNLADVTVKKHITNILSKLDVANRTQAALYAVQLGIV